MSKKLETITCPNPECHKKIRELIVVSDVSTSPVEWYYACPFCFFKMDVISAQLPKEEERKEESLVESPGEEEKAPSGCPHHFGYLGSRAKDAPIPQECLTCQKVLDCVTKSDAQ